VCAAFGGSGPGMVFGIDDRGRPSSKGRKGVA
jgi:hypothetical protein